LQDRAGTALHLAEHPSGDSLDQMQIEDALGRLRQLNTGDAVNLDIPWQRLLGGIALCLFAAGLIGWGIIAPRSAANTATAASTEDINDEVAQQAAVEAVPMTPGLVEQSINFARSEYPDGESGRIVPADGELADRYFDARESQQGGGGI
jgi:hypothetical protein